MGKLLRYVLGLVSMCCVYNPVEYSHLLLSSACSQKISALRFCIVLLLKSSRVKMAQSLI